jgi:hypothetical protein
MDKDTPADMETDTDADTDMYKDMDMDKWIWTWTWKSLTDHFDGEFTKNKSVKSVNFKNS